MNKSEHDKWCDYETGKQQIKEKNLPWYEEEKAIKELAERLGL